MILDRYYYQQLTEKEQQIYREFYHGIMKQDDIIPISVHGKLEQESFERVFMAMTRDNPLIYFLNQSACSTATDIFGHTAICPQYFFPKEKVREYNRKIEIAVNSIVEKLELIKCGEYERELRIHDWICKNVSYDFDGSDKENVPRVISSHNILCVFAFHKAQCEGIAKAFKVLLNTVDIKCIVVTGEAGKNGRMLPHAWNVVNIDGKAYQVDVTWNIGAGRKEKVAHNYFNVVDEIMKKDHKVADTLPKCR